MPNLRGIGFGQGCRKVKNCKGLWEPNSERGRNWPGSYMPNSIQELAIRQAQAIQSIPILK